jgi:hypothetical protein
VDQARRLRKSRWQRRHLDPGAPRRPVFVVGCHRSGTNMVMWTVERSPEVWVYHEHRLSPAFWEYRLRSTETLQRVIRRSPAPVVLFKPVCDSHLTDRLLARHEGSRAIWIYRRYQDVTNSAVRNFGPHQRDMLGWIARGDYDLLGWRGERLRPDFVELVQELYREDMSFEEASALIWYNRTGGYFDQGLDRDEHVLLVRYEDLVGGSEAGFRRVFDFLRVGFNTAFLDRVFASSIGKDEFPPIGDRVRGLCEELTQRLDRAHAQQAGRSGSDAARAVPG